MCGSDRLAALLTLAMANGAAVTAPASTQAPSANGHLDLIQVPAQLARRSSIEPSGIAWAKALDRYLIVTDDTSRKEHHQPWVLAMSRTGVFDDAVVPIVGIDELNDAESICVVPQGDKEGGKDGALFFVATSHSPNRKGHTPEARRMLLLTRLEGRALRVEGRVDLTTARNSAGQGLLEIAGLPTDGRLDIEAITFHDGALLIGLKSPVSVRKGAVALRFESPIAATRAGTIPVGAVTRAWEVSLAGGGNDVPRGIADLTTLPDRSLIVVANAPKSGSSDKGGADKGGAVFWLRPGGVPQMLHWFEHERPEGVTVAEDGKSLVVVFDNHDRPPFWTHLPLPGAGGTANAHGTAAP